MGTTSILNTQPYRGTRDFFPPEMRKLNYVFSVWRKVAESFGYEEYSGPLLEPWELYATKNVSGEEIVNKQLYWFEDQGSRKVAIRPEMTPTVARMIAARAKQLPKPIRWFSIANFMRYERPQKGRVREFFQLNLDIFGASGVSADVEVIETAIEMMREFGADENMFEIKVNNRGFIDYWLMENLKFENGNLKMRICRVVDRVKKQSEESTVKQLEELGLAPDQVQLVLSLPKLSLREVDRMKDENSGAADLVVLFDLLTKRSLDKYVKFDASLMRGFDYYTGNVFEQFDLTPGSTRSMFGGGRYDNLVDIFGVEPVTAVGYAPGDVTTLQFLENWNLLPDLGGSVDVLVTVFNEDLRRNSWQAAQQLRESGIRTEFYLKTGDTITAQLNYANRKNIPNVIIIGQGEADIDKVVCKNMESGEQNVLPIEEAIKGINPHKS